MTRSLPARPDPEFDRNRAKALKKAHGRGEAETLARIRELHPRFRGAADAEIAAAPFKLADAQLVVAREYGVESWPRLLALVRFLRADFDGRARLFLEAATGPHPRRARDLLERAPELARASLQAACAAADERAAEDWLAKDPSAATRGDGPFSAPPLWTLCWSGVGPDGARLRIARKLLDAGADPDAGVEPEPAHRWSALYGSVLRNRPALVELLLETGADPDDGESIYHATENGDGECLRLLLAKGARTAGTNALARALDMPAPEPVRLLLAAGADPRERCGQRDGLQQAVFRGRADLIADLVRCGADLEVRTPEGRSVFQMAWRQGHRDVAERLLALGADGALSPADRLVGACAVADEREARALLASGEIALEALDADDLGALGRAAERGHAAAVRLMLDLGFPVEAEGGEWRGTPLNHAAHASHPRVAALLLERGADPEIENEHGGTALGALVWSSVNWALGNPTFAPARSEEERQRDLVACVDLLVAAGARILPHHAANASPEVREALLRHGAPAEQE